jgi:hypothetical protein
MVAQSTISDRDRGDEYVIFTSYLKSDKEKIKRSNLDLFAFQLKAAPNDVGYGVICLAQSAKTRRDKYDLEGIRSYLFKKKVDKNRFRLIYETNCDRGETKFYMAPADAPPPLPFDSL